MDNIVQSLMNISKKYGSAVKEVYKSLIVNQLNKLRNLILDELGENEYRKTK